MSLIKFGILGIAIGVGAAFAQMSPVSLGFEFQRLNNCGPVTAKMALSLFGVQVSQAQAASALKSSYLDRNVTTSELANYLQANGFKTIRRWLITPALVRRLVKANFPVILHQDQKANSDIGHFRVAYATDSKSILFGDSMFGAKFRLTDREFQGVSRAYNGEYLIAYRAVQAPALEKILGRNWNKKNNLLNLEANARKRLSATPNDAYAWWGLGQSLLYQDQSLAASKAFGKANALGLTARHYWYQHDALEAWNRTGQYQQTIRVAGAALKGYPNSRELNGFYAVALEQVKQYKKALAAWRAAYKEDPRSSQIGAAIRRLTKKISTL